MKKGDYVKLVKLLSDTYTDWEMNEVKFNYLKSLINETGKITYAQKHYEDDGTKSLYIDVEFKCGFKLNRANAIQFKLFEN